MAIQRKKSGLVSCSAQIRKHPAIVVWVVLLCFFAAPRQAEAIDWDGGGDGVNWSDPANWVGDVVPQIGDSIDIDGDFGEIHLDVNFVLEHDLILLADTAGGLVFVIDSGVTLTHAGDRNRVFIRERAVLRNEGVIDSASTLNRMPIVGAFVNEGIVNLTDISGNSITNNGTFNGPRIRLGNNGDTFNNNGTYNDAQIWTNTSAANVNTINNSATGIINIDPTASSSLLQASSAVFNNDGIVTNPGSISNQGTFNNNGTLDNTGGDFNNQGIFNSECGSQILGTPISGNAPILAPGCDILPPVITVPADISIEATSSSGTVVSYTANANDDTDGPITPTCIPVSGSSFSLGTTAVICTATDQAGNAASAAFGVNVVDTTPPTLTVPADVTQEANAPLSTIVIGNATATDIFAVTITNNAPAAFPLGPTVVTWTATDASGNSASATQLVTVQDTTPPIIFVPADVAFEASGPTGAVVTFPSPVVTDLVDPSPSLICSPASGSIFALGDTTVMCTATDFSLNSTTAAFTVSVVDTTAPALSGLPANITELATSAAGRVVDYALPTATDIVDANPQVSCDPAPGTTFAIGTTTVTCTATDASGNSSSGTFTVTINAPDLDGDGIPDIADDCPADPFNTCDPTGSGAETVDSTDGGTVTTTDGGVTIEIPPGALNEDTTISITDTGSNFELTANLGQALGVFGVNIQPEGTTFNTPITITFTWDDVDNDGRVDGTNIKEDNLHITKDGVAITDQCRNEPLCDTVNNTFSFTVSSLSLFALIGPLDSDNDGVFDDFDGITDFCPLEDATGFDANVDGCIDTLSGLTEVVETLVTEGVISEQLKNSLLSKVGNASKSVDKEHICTAVNVLGALKNEVTAQTGRKISPDAAILLQAFADNVIVGLLAQLPVEESCS